MPFGAMFGAIVFGVLGVWLGVLRLFAPVFAYRLIGGSLIVLGGSVAIGLLTRRSWARWLGAASGPWFAFYALPLAQRDGVVGMLVLLASLFAAVLLVVPFTGRFHAPVPVVPAAAPSRAGRAVLLSSFIAFVTLAFASAWAFVSVPPPSAAGREQVKHSVATSSVAWNEFTAGINQAKASRKLVVADFYATWCGPCKAMDKETFRDPRVVSRLQDVVPVRVDSEEEVDRGGVKGAELANRYGIEAYPTIVVLDGNGREVARNTGFLPANEFLSWLDAVIERAGTSIARS